RRDCQDLRTYREDAHPAEKDTPPPEAIGPSAGPDHPRGYNDRVTGKDPRQRSCADFGEITTNVAEGDVEDHRVEAHHEASSGNDREACPRAPCLSREQERPRHSATRLRRPRPK